METFGPPRGLVVNPGFPAQRSACLDRLDLAIIDAPIRDVVGGLAELACAFPMQSCCGHFLYEGQDDERSTAPLPPTPVEWSIDYRIAYLAWCVEDSAAGRALLRRLSRVTRLDPDFIQFGCAAWFWDRQVNSYALQVEPVRCQYLDLLRTDDWEARRIERVRDRFLAEVATILREFRSG